MVFAPPGGTAHFLDACSLSKVWCFLAHSCLEFLLKDCLHQPPVAGPATEVHSLCNLNVVCGASIPLHSYHCFSSFRELELTAHSLNGVEEEKKELQSLTQSLQKNLEVSDHLSLLNGSSLWWGPNTLLSCSMNLVCQCQSQPCADELILSVADMKAKILFRKESEVARNTANQTAISFLNSSSISPGRN